MSDTQLLIMFLFFVDIGVHISLYINRKDNRRFHKEIIELRKKQDNLYDLGYKDAIMVVNQHFAKIEKQLAENNETKLRKDEEKK